MDLAVRTLSAWAKAVASSTHFRSLSTVRDQTRRYENAAATLHSRERVRDSL
jgi:hypothetical protein